MTFIFENLEVYKKAIEFSKQILLHKKYFLEKVISDQITRASISIPLNLAEGQGRMHPREKRQFYNTARGSLLECVPLLQLSREMGHIGNEQYEQLYLLANEIGKMLSGLIRVMNERENRE